jgi:predicted ATPase
MLKKWSLHNFKSVQEECELDLAPLTLLAGPNSSGKSSLIQSILLLCQSTSNRDFDKSIILNGMLTLLGEMADVKSFDSLESEVSIGWELQPVRTESFSRYGDKDPFSEVLKSQGMHSYRIESTSGTIKFDSPTVDEESQISARLTYCKLRARERFDETTVDEAQIVLNRSDFNRVTIQSQFDFPEMININFGEGTEYSVALDTQSMEEIRNNLSSAEVIGSGVRHFLPTNLVVKYDLAEEVIGGLDDFSNNQARIFSSRQSVRLPDSLIRRLREFGIDSKKLILLNDLSRALKQSKNLRTAYFDWYEDNRKDIVAELLNLKSSAGRVLDLPSILDDASRYTESFFAHNVRYLGPLRDAPKSVYPLAARIDARDLGLKGENTAAVLHQFKERSVWFIPPSELETSLNSDHRASILLEPTSLQKAVTQWLVYLGVAEEVSTKDRGKEGHELKVRLRGLSKAHDLTHAGVGVSQVLPIVVMGLLAERGTCMLFEQPELHLHPSVQSRLADFFVSLSLMSKQCIVETHSEYIVDRLRYRTAQALTGNMLNLFKIYFVEKHHGKSVFNEVGISKYGAIQNWPSGFFDQSQRETTNILLAATEKLESEENLHE